MRHRLLAYRFVEFIPEKLEPGVLYVSTTYATAAHSCCCGCGEEIVTPFAPTDWKMTFDGESISLWPSIGNWTLDCRSHYVIERNRVIESGPWTDRQIAAARSRDKAAKARHYGTAVSLDPSADDVARTDPPNDGFWRRVRRRMTRDAD